MTFQSFTAKEYLKIDIANSFGLDKKNWDERITWFDENETILDTLMSQAKEPAMFFAGITAWNQMKKKLPVNHPISLDATSSGIQLLSCLTGDRKAAELCNVVDTGERENAYELLYRMMMEKVGEEGKIDLDDTKRAIMTAFYASRAVPKEVFGEGELLDIFYKTMAEAAPYAWELNETMVKLWDPETLMHSWVLPNNFHVNIKVMGLSTGVAHFLNKPYDITYLENKPMEEGRSLGANMTHSVDGMVVSEMGWRCNYNPEHINILKCATNAWDFCGSGTGTKEDELVKTLWGHYEDSGFLSARILNYLNIDNLKLVDGNVILALIESLPVKPFKILSVHDCFRCLANYGNDLRRQYNQILSDIARSDLLSFILSQIIGRVVSIPKADTELWKDILEANYTLS